MKPYEIIEHTADVGEKVNGSTLKELFENAARGMFDIIAGKKFKKDTAPKKQKEIHVDKEVEGFEELLVDWLSELLYISDKEEIVFNNFKILKLNKSGLIGKAYGQKIDLKASDLHAEIKAVTFHGLNIKKDEDGFSCNIIFDV